MRRRVRALVAVAALTVSALVIGGPSAIAQPTRPANSPCEGCTVQGFPFADNADELYVTGRYVTISPTGITNWLYDHNGSLALQDTAGSKNCLQFDGSHFNIIMTTCSGIAAQEWISLSDHNYSEWENLARYGGAYYCLWENGPGANVYPSGCSGISGNDRWNWSGS